MNNRRELDTISQAMADPSRRAILDTLRLGRSSVTDLVESTGLKQPNLSNHLGKMRSLGIVHAERMGRRVYYSIATPIADMMLRLEDLAAGALFAGAARSVSAREESRQAQRLSSSEKGAVPEPIEGGGEGAIGIDAWRNRYWESIMSGPADAAPALVNAMLAHRLSMDAIYVDVFQWALERVGEHVEQGLIDVAGEHLASAITERMMARVMAFYTPVPRTARQAVLGCVAGNWHAVGLRMISDMLQSLGWDVLFLGADVPTMSFAAKVRAARPDLVLVSCSMETQAAELLSLLEGLEAARRGNPAPRFAIAVGGRWINAHPETIEGAPADFTAPDLVAFRQALLSRFPI